MALVNIRAKLNKAGEKIDGLIRSPVARLGADRILVVYGEAAARIYYEGAPVAPKVPRPN